MDVADKLRAAVADRYTIERELGQGGMAVVYLARDLKHDRQVALKVLRPELAATLGPDRFLREIKIAAQLQHPNILGVHDSGEAAGFLYYVMPFVEGHSLRERLAKEGELPVPEACRILRDVADALSAAHEKGVVHRDIKPENVLLTGRHALVADFGVAKAVSEATGRQTLTTAGVALGTPTYMAPEQAAASPHIDHRADLYAFGVMAYEMLTGQPPFSALTPQALLAAHVTEPPLEVTQRRATIPPPLAQLIMRCLAKKAADRPQTAEELLPVLESFTTPSGGITPTQTQPVSAARPHRRLRMVLAVGAAVVVVAIGSFVLLRHRSPVIASAERIAILPFSPAAPDSSLSRLGRELMVLLSANLDGVGAISTVDASALLARIGSADAPIALERGAALGKSFGAASVLTGSLVRAGGGIRVEATLATTDGLKPIARLSVASASADVGPLADSLTWALLGQVWRGRQAPTPFLVAHMTSSFEALRAFLAGEQAFTEGRYPAASEAYGRAIAADSTFWLAYWRLTTSNGWVFRDTPERIVAAYWEHRAALPERDRMLIEANRQPTRSQAMAMRLEVTRRYPDYAPAWWAYADPLAHSGGFYGHPFEDALAGLLRVAELSPASASAWDHVAWAYQLLGDSAGSARALDALARLHARTTLLEGYGWDMVGYLRLGHRLRFESAEVTPAVVDSALAITSAAVQTIPGMFRFMPLLIEQLSPRLQLEVSRLLLARGVPREQAVWLRRGSALAWMTRGAWDSAFAAIDAYLAADAPAGGHLEAYRFATLAAWLEAVHPDSAAARRAAAEREASQPADRAELAWLDGVLGAARRDPAAVRSARSRLRGLQAPSAAQLDRALAALEAELMGTRGSAARQLLALVQATGDSSMQRRYVTFDAIARLAVSRWLLAEGDAAAALPPLYWAEAWYTGPAVSEVIEVVGGIVSLQRARVEEALGRAADATRHYREFLRVYDMPAARHRELVTEAQQALARLGARP